MTHTRPATTARQVCESYGFDYWDVVRRPYWEDRLQRFFRMTAEVRLGATSVIQRNRVAARKRDTNGRFV